MWDKRVVENLDKFVGEYSVGCSFKNSKDGFLLAFVGIYGLIWITISRFYWKSLQACVLGGMSCSVLVGISI